MAALDLKEILAILPHRYPFLLVDRILECDDQKRIVGLKNVTVNEPFFQGHFPGMPIMPGVLQLEAMAQVGGVLLGRKTGSRGNLPLFMAIDRVKFRRMVIPGDALRIEVEITSERARIVRVAGRGLVGDELASEAELLFMFTDLKSQP